LLVLAVFAALIGVAALRRLAYGLAGLAAFTLIGLGAVLTRPDHGSIDALPVLVGAVVGAFTMVLLVRGAADTDRALPAFPAPPASARRGGPGGKAGGPPAAGGRRGGGRGRPGRRPATAGQLAAPFRPAAGARRARAAARPAPVPDHWPGSRRCGGGQHRDRP